jgi:hypothetical protein
LALSLYTFLAYALKLFMTAFNYSPSLLSDVTPIIFLLKLATNLFIYCGVSLSGSTEIKTSFNFIYAPSGIFLIILKIVDM